ncbi:MAG: excinuclease ABC subunit UvrC [Sphingomonadales bacterium]|nr:MAG: excinuclease ABC subunit UvrC [Sphingomonadales bacterium]
MSTTPPFLPDRLSEEQSAYVVAGSDAPDLDQGVAVIRKVLEGLPTRPGVYRMLSSAGDVLYVGKARNLRARVVNYTQVTRLPNRLQRMVAQTRSMLIVTTQTEAEALLLEANLIKQTRAPYNVLLRDDKSFPYIMLRRDHAYAQIAKHRGARKPGADYYGPFASGTAVNRTLKTLQRVFLLRSCSDGIFSNRTRPCLLHQIKRCAAPCVGRVADEDYAALVEEARAFLSGKSVEIQKRLAEQMQDAAARLDFEAAAVLRDRLRALTYVQQSTGLNAGSTEDADVIAAAQSGGVTCIQVFFVRGGQNWGNRAFFPRHDRAEPVDAVLSAFLGQFYDAAPPAPRVLLDRPLEDMALIAEALGVKAGRRIAVEAPQRGGARPLIELAQRNAQEALDQKLAESASQSRLIGQVARLFDLDPDLNRIEVYDNSHIQGRHAVGVMVVAGPDGFRKAAYRRYNFKPGDHAPGDDFAMMGEMLRRRFRNAGDDGADAGEWPDLLLIDGGKGQVGAVRAALEELGVEDVPIVGVAKGPDRNAGREVFHLADGREFTLEPGDPVLFYLQRLRDEAHRFAIGSHRAKRAKAQTASPLDGVPGIGPTRKKALLLHFGSAKAVARAGVADLARVDGVSQALAQTIYDHFHGG